MNHGHVPEHPNKLRPIATTNKEHVTLSRQMLGLEVIVTSPVEDTFEGPAHFQTATEGNWVDPEKQEPKEKSKDEYDVPIPTAPLWMAIVVLIIVTGVSRLIRIILPSCLSRRKRTYLVCIIQVTHLSSFVARSQQRPLPHQLNERLDRLYQQRSPS